MRCESSRYEIYTWPEHLVIKVIEVEYYML